MKALGLVWMTLMLVLVSCVPNTVDQGALTDRRINVVATIGQIADVAQIVGGERVEAIGLMGPGTDPHLYRASEGDVRRLSEADVIFYNGLALEARMGDILAQMGRQDKTTVAVAEQIDENLLLASPEFDGNYDPHIWFDVELWMIVVEIIRDTYAEFDPENADLYQANAAAYLVELQELQADILEQVERIPETQRVLITAHDAFNYFGRAYGFEVRGLQGISTEAEAGTADVQELAAYITENEIPAIFIESSVPIRNIEAVQAAVQSRGFDVQVGGELFSDAMGEAGTVEGTYIGMVRHNVDTIVGALTR